MEWIVEVDIKRNADPEGSMINCICVEDVCIAYLPCKTVFQGGNMRQSSFPAFLFLGSSTILISFFVSPHNFIVSNINYRPHQRTFSGEFLFQRGQNQKDSGGLFNSFPHFFNSPAMKTTIPMTKITAAATPPYTNTAQTHMGGSGTGPKISRIQMRYASTTESMKTITPTSEMIFPLLVRLAMPFLDIMINETLQPIKRL